jgi:hypothetical protein
MEDPTLVTLVPEEEPEQPPPPAEDLGRKLVVQIVALVCLKVATGIVIRSLSRTIRDFDVLYPEHLNRIRWRD